MKNKKVEKILATRIRYIRVEVRNETIREVSKNTGLTSACICQIENCKRIPSVSTLVKLADYLEVSIDWLLRP